MTEDYHTPVKNEKQTYTHMYRYVSKPSYERQEEYQNKRKVNVKMKQKGEHINKTTPKAWHRLSQKRGNHHRHCKHQHEETNIDTANINTRKLT